MRFGNRRLVLLPPGLEQFGVTLPVFQLLVSTTGPPRRTEAEGGCLPDLGFLLRKSSVFVLHTSLVYKDGSGDRSPIFLQLKIPFS